VSQKYQHIKNKFFQLVLKINTSIKKFFEKTQANVLKVKNYPLKEKLVSPVKNRVEKTKSFFQENKTFKEKFSFFQKISEPLKNFIIKKVNSLTPQQILGGITFCVIAILTGITVFDATKEIYHKEAAKKPKDRKIASETEDQVRGLPYFYKLQQRTSQLTHLKLPVFLENTGRYKNLLIDISIIFKTVTSKKFFDQHQHLFLDKIQTGLEPIIPSFPIKPEGKEILRQKIKMEFDGIYFDREMENDGIEQVVINYINVT
jgi:hypothetical protein